MNLNAFQPPIIPPPPQSSAEVWRSSFEKIWPGRREQMLSTPQDPVYHAEGDVWTHTVMVVDQLLASSGYQTASLGERFVLWMAAMGHDVAKPSTTKDDGQGKIIAPGHSRKGAIDTRLALWEMNVPWGVRETISALITYHQVPFHAFSSRDQSHPEYIARKVSLDTRIDLLCTLARADLLGRICPDQNKILDEINLFEELAKEMGCLDQPYRFPSPASASRYVLSRGRWGADQDVFEDHSCQVWVLSGLPASGKTTWREEKGLPFVSYDDTRQKMKLRHGQDPMRVAHAVTEQAREFLRKGQDFIWDATHLTMSSREKALNLARQYKAKTHLVCLEAPKDDVFDRNANRQSSLSNQDLAAMTLKWDFPMAWEAGERLVCQSNKPASRHKPPLT